LTNSYFSEGLKPPTSNDININKLQKYLQCTQDWPYGGWSFCCPRRPHRAVEFFHFLSGEKVYSSPTESRSIRVLYTIYTQVNTESSWMGTPNSQDPSPAQKYNTSSTKSIHLLLADWPDLYDGKLEAYIEGQYPCFSVGSLSLRELCKAVRLRCPNCLLTDS
jgi:hypothetical protein